MKRSRFVITGIVIVMILTAISGMVAFSDPGDTDDPVVTKSYILDKVVPDIKAYVDEKLGGGGDGGGSASFVVVEVPDGKSVICKAGAELILRQGSGTIIATQKGGLADTTAGYDLSDGTPMPSNHLLIVPVNDGRGFKANNNVIVMIKGGYEIK